MKKVAIFVLVLLCCLFFKNHSNAVDNQVIILTLEELTPTKTISNESRKPKLNNVKTSTDRNSYFVVIDPGHGTIRSRGGANKEAFYNLAIAKKVLLYLENDTKITAVLTHSFIGENLGAKNADDDNRIRAGIANRVQAKLFLRLHCDSPSGATTVYFPRLHSNRKIAKESGRFAEIIGHSLISLYSGLRYGGIKGDESTAIGSKNGGLLTGSKESQVPVVLIEMVPLNQAGIRWIDNDTNQDNLAKLIAKDIKESIL